MLGFVSQDKFVGPGVYSIEYLVRPINTTSLCAEMAVADVLPVAGRCQHFTSFFGAYHLKPFLDFQWFLTIRAYWPLLHRWRR